MTWQSEPRISSEQVRETARLARLSFTDAEVDTLRGELARILTYVSILEEVDNVDEAPLHMLHGHTTSARPDEETGSLSRPEALHNAPESDGRFVRVPRVL